jgi:hypothetical protein
MYLTQDVRSAVNPKKIYGLKGQRVTLLEYRGSIALVEIEKDKGFPVKAELLSISKK